MTSDAVATAADRNEQVVSAGELDSRNDIGHSGAADDECWALIDHTVPDFAGRLVARVNGTQQLTPHAAPEGLDGCCLEHAVRALYGGDSQVCHGSPPFCWFIASTLTCAPNARLAALYTSR